MHELVIKKLATDLSAKNMVGALGILSAPLVGLMVVCGLALRQSIVDLKKVMMNWKYMPVNYNIPMASRNFSQT